MDGPSAEVLRYGIELMEWNAAWWADLERRLSLQADRPVDSRRAESRGRYL